MTTTRVWGYGPHRNRRDQAKPLKITPQGILTAVNQEITPILDLMERTWGFRPLLNVTAELKPFGNEPAVCVKADFNIKGFAHKARKQFITQRAYEKYRKPRLIARTILAELVDHRATCRECGLGIANIHARALGAEAQTHKTDGVPPGHVITYERTERRKIQKIFLNCQVPPDQVERKLYPKVAQLTEDRLRREGVI